MEMINNQNEIQLVLLSTEDSNPQTGFFTNTLSKPLQLEGEWYVALESIIVPRTKGDKIVPVLVTIDCTVPDNSGDVLAFFLHDGAIPEYHPIWRKVSTDLLDNITVRLQDFHGEALDLIDNNVALLLKFKKLYKDAKQKFSKA